jgi:hypothetical protein
MSTTDDDYLRATAEALRAHLAELERSRVSQPDRLAEARAQAEDERIKSLVAEPWSDFITGIPTVDFSAMLALPTIDAKEVFGTRLAFDLLGCCADEDQVAETLRECFKMTGDPGHAFLVYAAALETIANHVMPALLDTYEDKSGDYETRVRLADAARNAWAARVADLGEFAEADE